MSEQLYRKVEGKRVRYVPVVPEPELQTVLQFSDAQCITAAGALGMTLLMVFERNLPPHKKVARKIKAVESAILDLFHGTGESIDPEIADLFCKTWDRTMLALNSDTPPEVTP